MVWDVEWHNPESVSVTWSIRCLFTPGSWVMKLFLELILTFWIFNLNLCFFTTKFSFLLFILLFWYGMAIWTDTHVWWQALRCLLLTGWLVSACKQGVSVISMKLIFCVLYSNLNNFLSALIMPLSDRKVHMFINLPIWCDYNK